MQPGSILIFGHGQLGTFYRDYFLARGVTVVAPDVDIRDSAGVRVMIQNATPDVVINVAAKTNIDWCEQNKLTAFDINTQGAANIGAACAEAGVYLIHLSSGCVQESKTPGEVWKEDDPVAPLCFYSWTKVWAENLLNDLAARHGLKVLILRPRQLLSAMVSPRNAVTKLLTYRTFIDMANSCTIVEDLMTVTDTLVARDATGTYNVVNPGVITPYEIALLLKEIIRPDMVIEKISKDALNAMTLAKRVDCVLSGEKLAALGITLKDIHERLREILFQFKERLQTDEGRAALALTNEETSRKLSLVLPE
ncbi:hypothetical protein A3H75_02615 [Candidatus Uhrbacteria bacterium RIFCSPLOWO2_02_FULL_51_9]|uniref:dTDP-4-dehydrorhamnose reductase n=1 Tax=Candidatus Uhrbacteria bacterium RIFCSPLOWO2_02_FULL_51_9 TaxID=1802410 RepID=A0A1F7VDA7_9BACT|nr:MAG: hypothetical protein A3H75_02615 [Candidatus Uhrbacteria bacterium RIFCSPLOWO2_02_FULL_51_9]